MVGEASGDGKGRHHPSSPVFARPASGPAHAAAGLELLEAPESPIARQPTTVAPGPSAPRSSEQDPTGRGPAALRRTTSPDPLPAELQPFRPALAEDVLFSAARRARLIGVGGDEVLIAEGHVSPEAATRRLADHLGLAIAPLDAADGPHDGPFAEATLRTGVRLEPQGEELPHYTLAPNGRDLRRLMRGLRADGALARRVRLMSPPMLRRQVMASAGALLADKAAFGLLRQHPEKSAAALDAARLVLGGGLAIAAPVAGLLLAAPAATALAVQAVASLVFLSWIALRLAGCFYRPPPEPPLDLPERRLPIYSILVPLYREAASVPGLVAALCALDYPALGSKRTTNDGVYIG